MVLVDHSQVFVSIPLAQRRAASCFVMVVAVLYFNPQEVRITTIRERRRAAEPSQFRPPGCGLNETVEVLR